MVIEYTSNTHRDRSLTINIISFRVRHTLTKRCRNFLDACGETSSISWEVTVRSAPANVYDAIPASLPQINSTETILWVRIENLRFSCEQRRIKILSAGKLGTDKSHCSPSVRSDCVSAYFVRKTKSTKIEAPLPKRASMPLKIYSKSMKTWLLAYYYLSFSTYLW